MAEELVMPRLSDTMERGTIARWVKQEGESFVNGDVLAEIETDKALMELAAYDDGVLLKILVPDGGEAELGAPIAITGEAGETVPAELLQATPAAAAPADEPTTEGAPASTAAAAAAPAASELRASPIARKLASENGIDLRSLRPLDIDTCIASVRKTTRALVAEEGWATFGIGAEIAARLHRACFDELDAPVERVGGAEAPMPYAKNLENAALAQEDKIGAAARRLLADCGMMEA